MTTYTINIGGKVCVAEGTHIDDINPNNGHPYEVVTLKDLRIGGKGENVLRYLIDKDKVLRTAERDEVRMEYDGELCLNLVYGRGKKNGVSCLKPPTRVGFQHTNEWRIRHVAEYRSPV